MNATVGATEDTPVNTPEETPERTTETLTRFCDSEPCEHGTCEEREGSGFFCTCDQGFFGVHCNQGRICVLYNYGSVKIKNPYLHCTKIVGVYFCS